MPQDIRWKQRFQNFNRALVLLREPIKSGIENLSELEKEGTVQRFEVAFELGWKTMKDYLEYEGVVLSPVSARAVLKEAFTSGVVANGQTWLSMLDHRNLMSHTYDQAEFQRLVEALRDRYLEAFEALHAWFTARMADK